jgi:hypothetical protein
MRSRAASEASWNRRCLLLVVAFAACSPYDDSLLAGKSDAARSMNPPGSSLDGATSTETQDASNRPSEAEVWPPDSETEARGDALLDGIVEAGRDSDGQTTDHVLDTTGTNDDAPRDIDTVDGDARTTADAFDASTIAPGLIDDMEDNDSFILAHEGRQGFWFRGNDGTPDASQIPGSPFTMTPIAGGRSSSVFAVRTSGYGFTSWMPLVGFWINQPSTGPKQVYDARRYLGITFWARHGTSDAATFSPAVRVVIPDRDTDPDGMVCIGAGCHDHFGVNVTLTAQWVQYTILFSQIAQAGWGTQASGFDPANVYGIQFLFPVGSTFDCWIDDLAFVLP